MVKERTLGLNTASAEGVPERLFNFAAELVRLNVNVIVEPGSGARAAKKAADKIPKL